MKHTTPATTGSPSGTQGGAVSPSARRSRVKDTATALLVVATVLAGALGPMQAAVNGQLGKTIGDGHAAALISFGTGLVLMFVVVFARPATRREALAIPGLIRSRTIPWWNYLAGLCGAVIVLSEGVTVGAVVADVTARASVEVRFQQNDDRDDDYVIHAAGVYSNYPDYDSAIEAAGREAERIATEEARRRGAMGVLTTQVQVNPRRAGARDGTQVDLGTQVVAKVTGRMQF